MSQVPLSELQKLSPDAIIELFSIDLTSIGGDIFYFHAGTNEVNQNIVWQGIEYVRFPVTMSGFETTSSGTHPRPTMAASNILSAITALILGFNDMIGAVVTRKRTLKQYLDAVNFVGGVNPTADPDTKYDDDVFTIETKVSENQQEVVFELVSKVDLQGMMLPRRQIIQNSCTWRYRSSECGYVGTNYFDQNDQPAPDISKDVCAKRLTSCKARFGENEELPFGGFPGAGLVGGG